MLARRVRLLTTVDEGHRESLEIAMAVSLPSQRAVRVLKELVALHGRPSSARVDNGPESTAQPLSTGAPSMEWPRTISSTASPMSLAIIAWSRSFVGVNRTHKREAIGLAQELASSRADEPNADPPP